MAEDAPTRVAGGLVLGGLVGFGLYLLVTGLGGRGGQGVPASRDSRRLSFVMTRPTVPGDSASFRMRGGAGPDARTFSLEELIARVRAGGRSDVELRAAGDVLQGPWERARALVEQAGLTVWKDEDSSFARVSGNGRGQYGPGNSW